MWFIRLESHGCEPQRERFSGVSRGTGCICVRGTFLGLCCPNRACTCR
jgi:hypothetical protein